MIGPFERGGSGQYHNDWYPLFQKEMQHIALDGRLESTDHTIRFGTETRCPVVAGHHPCGLHCATRKECCHLPVEQVFIAEVLRCHYLLLSPRTYGVIL